MLKNDKFQLLWCELPRSDKRNTTTAALSTTVKKLMTIADEVSIQAFCIGHKQANWHKIPKGPWTRNTNHMCALPAKFGQQKEPSSVIYHAYSNKQKIDEKPCRCPSNTKHVFDLPPCRNGSDQIQKRDSDDQQDARRTTALHILYDRLLPDRTQAYPTEARNAEKARLAKGHIPKKQVKFVEDYFDDLGDDLRGRDPNIHLLALDSQREEIEPSDDEGTDSEPSWLLADPSEPLKNIYKTTSMSDMLTHHREEVQIYMFSLNPTHVVIRSQPTAEHTYPLQTTLDMSKPHNKKELAAWCKGAKVSQLSTRYQHSMEGTIAQNTCMQIYEAALAKGISADCATPESPHYVTGVPTSIPAQYQSRVNLPIPPSPPT